MTLNSKTKWWPWNSYSHAAGVAGLVTCFFTWGLDFSTETGGTGCNSGGWLLKNKNHLESSWEFSLLEITARKTRWCISWFSNGAYCLNLVIFIYLSMVDFFLSIKWSNTCITWVRKTPWRRKWQPTPVFLPGESRGQRSLVGYNPKGHKELDVTEWLTQTYNAIYSLTNFLNFNMLESISSHMAYIYLSCLRKYYLIWALKNILYFL